MSWINAWWQRVSSTVSQGLEITLVGMALVFLTLALIIVALILLTQLPGLKVEQPKKKRTMPENTPTQTNAPLAIQVQTDQETELAHVAAIAVAVLRGKRATRLRPRAKTRTSRWKQYGRAHQLGL